MPTCLFKSLNFVLVTHICLSFKEKKPFFIWITENNTIILSEKGTHICMCLLNFVVNRCKTLDLSEIEEISLVRTCLNGFHCILERQKSLYLFCTNACPDSMACVLSRLCFIRRSSGSCLCTCMLK